ncbi:hypothetical protein RJ639_023542, partial [Escallonia herrerae]
QERQPTGSPDRISPEVLLHRLVRLYCRRRVHMRSVDLYKKGLRQSLVSQPELSGEILAAEVASRRSWLKDYVDRISAISDSSRAMSFWSFGRFFTGSSRQSKTPLSRLPKM